MGETPGYLVVKGRGRRRKIVAKSEGRAGQGARTNGWLDIRLTAVWARDPSRRSVGAWLDLGETLYVVPEQRLPVVRPFQQRLSLCSLPPLILQSQPTNQPTPYQPASHSNPEKVNLKFFAVELLLSLNYCSCVRS